jgi:hypothetical protein
VLTNAPTRFVFLSAHSNTGLLFICSGDELSREKLLWEKVPNNGHLVPVVKIQGNALKLRTANLNLLGIRVLFRSFASRLYDFRT